MNNPLYRKMFQQPGMSRQPLGILASSPQLANTVQQRQQPVRMAQGGLNTTSGNANNLQVVVKQLEALKQNGDAKALQRIAADPNQPGLVKRIANNFAQSLLPTSVPLVQVGDVNLGNALNDATNRSPIGQSVGGQERSAKLKKIPSKAVAAAGSGIEALTKVQGPALKDVYGPFPDSSFSALLRSQNIGQGGVDLGPKSPIFVPDESSGMDILGNQPTSMLGIPTVASGVATGLEKVFRANPIARAKGPVLTDPSVPFVPDMPSEGLVKGSSGPDLDDDYLIAPKPIVIESQTGKKSETQNSAEKDASKETNKSKYEVVESKPKLLTPENITLIGSDTPEGNDLTLKVGESLTEAGKNISTGDLGLSSTEDLVNSIFGVDDAVAAKTGKKPTKKEKVAAEMEILKEFFGEKAAKDIRTDFNYNLMMTGLLIAAGESPNAGTNIAKGLAAGLKTYGDATGEAAKQENELQQALGLQAYKNVTDELAAEKLSAAREKDTKIRVSAEIATANMNNNAAAQRLSAQLGNNRDQWKAQLAQADSQFDARMEIENKKLNLEPAEIRTLKTLIKQPELIEIMQKAAEAKDPNQTYSDILTGMLKSPLMMTQFTKADGSIDMQALGALARVGAKMAPSLSIGSTGSVETSAAGAGQQTTAIPAAPSGLPVGGKYSPQTKKWYTPDSSSSTGWSEWSGQAQ